MFFFFNNIIFCFNFFEHLINFSYYIVGFLPNANFCCATDKPGKNEKKNFAQPNPTDKNEKKIFAQPNPTDKFALLSVGFCCADVGWVGIFSKAYKIQIIYCISELIE